MFVPVKSYHQLLGFSSVELEVFLLAPVHKVLSHFTSSMRLCNIRELVWVASGGVVEVCIADGDKQQSQNFPQGDSHTAHSHGSSRIAISWCGSLESMW